MTGNTPATAVLDLALNTITVRIEEGGALTLHVTGGTGWGCTVNPVAMAEFAEQLDEVAHASMCHPNYRGPYPVRHKPGWVHLGSSDDGTMTDGEYRCGTWAADPDRQPHRCRLTANHKAAGWACEYEPAEPPATGYIREALDNVKGQ